MNEPEFVLAQVNLNNLGGTVELAILIVLLVIGITGLVVLGYALFPVLTSKTRQNVEQMPVRSFLVGLVNFLFFGFIGLAFGSAGAGLLAVIILVILFGLYGLGLAGMALLVGQRLRPGDVQPVRQILAGSLTLEMAAIVPFVGWFGVPVIALTGLGGLIIAFVTRKRKPAPPSTPPGPPYPPTGAPPSFPPDSNYYGPQGGKR